MANYFSVGAAWHPSRHGPPLAPRPIPARLPRPPSSASAARSSSARRPYSSPASSFAGELDGRRHVDGSDMGSAQEVVGGKRTGSPRQVDGNGREKRTATRGRGGIARRTGDERSRRSGVPSWREIISHCTVANAVANTVAYSVANPEIAVCALISFHWGCTVANSLL